MKGPESPRLFLVDGYALIYRAFFALISRPLTTSKGENTSASWGIANFLQRLITKHQPEYLGWVHDSGLSFRHERYPAYKATREKLTEELQSDFDRGMERIREMLDAYRIPILTLPGYEADDVIGTLVAKSVEAGVNVVVVSGDKDFQQLVKPWRLAAQPRSWRARECRRALGWNGKRRGAAWSCSGIRYRLSGSGRRFLGQHSWSARHRRQNRRRAGEAVRASRVDSRSTRARSPRNVRARHCSSTPRTRVSRRN